ncbi:unnamed protein product [marine sediment metagenome]|uniref:Nucleotidyl transferase AbiEii/AbiGii toxin family protein n=1 Tax=marine sediment metagenome TaxID=412755 RepID=X1G368_9ZZZZ
MEDIIRNKKVIDKIAHASKFENSSIERVLWMTQISKEIYKSEFLKNDFALMGGSAIAFLYGNIYRLSVDIDLDYINNHDLGKYDRNEITDLQSRHMSEFEKIAHRLKLEYQPVNQEDNRFLQLTMSYKSIYGQQKTIELDLGYRYCHTVLGTKKAVWPNIFEIENYKSLPVMTLMPEELWASKITAMIGTNRIDIKGKRYLGSKNKIRHLYDTWHLIDSEEIMNEINIGILKSLTILFGMTRVENYDLCRGDALALYSQADYDNDLYPVIRNTKDLPQLRIMQRDTRKFLDEFIFSYDENEYEFMEDFKSGNFRPLKILPPKIAKKVEGLYFYKEMLEIVKR